MKNTVTLQRSLRGSKIYGLIFILGALLNLALVGMIISPSFNFLSIHPEYLTSSWADFSAPLAFAIGLFTIGVLALRANRPTTVRALYLSAVIGLAAGGVLGGLLGSLVSLTIAHPSPEAGLGLGLLMILPLPLLIMQMHFTYGIVVIILPHFIAMLILGFYAFRIAQSSESVKYGIWGTLSLACIITLFTEIAGMVWVGASSSGFASSVQWGQLFILPLSNMLIYTLIIGVPAAFLGRAKSRHTPATMAS